MSSRFMPGGHAMLIGSQPLSDHDAATRLIMDHIACIPNWAQLPAYSQEGMVEQFMPGLPGLARNEDRIYVDTADEAFDGQLLEFFETYLAIVEQDGPMAPDSPFGLTPDRAKGFFCLLDALDTPPESLVAVKGQVTGPITFCTGLHDHQKRAIFYNDALRDAAVKMLALKAAWQADMLAAAQKPVIVFIDEPALAGFGSSELISISKADIATCLNEVIAALHSRGALAGVHVCANTDWSLLLDSPLDIINFDAHGYFDKFILYADLIRSFLDSGRYLAWGLVPTLNADDIKASSDASLWADWQEKSNRLVELGIPYDTLVAQSFITPSCGTGSLTPELSRRVIELTRALSDRIRQDVTQR